MATFSINPASVSLSSASKKSALSLATSHDDGKDVAGVDGLTPGLCHKIFIVEVAAKLYARQSVNGKRQKLSCN